MTWVEYLDDVGRVLAPLLLLVFVLRWALTTRWWVWWDTRALLVFMSASVLTKTALAVASAITPPRTAGEVPILATGLQIVFWWAWVCVAVFLLSSYELEQLRARVRAREAPADLR